jgi:hypothetical protein
VVIVTGPPGSGRTTTLRLLADQLGPAAVVIDDAEEAAEGVWPRSGWRLVGVDTDAWRTRYGDWLAGLRPASLGIALHPDPVRDATLWTVPLPGVGPRPPPGRGILVLDGTAEVVQVAGG